jgi:predicted aspartyl protease
MRCRYHCWLGVMLASLAVAEQPSAIRSSEMDARRQSETTIRFNLYRGYLILAQGSAGPLSNLNLLLDTGTSSTILDQRLARRLQLVEKSAVIAVTNGRVQARTATVPSLGIGPIRRENLPVLIQDLDFLQKALSVPVDAVIGLVVLGQVSFMVDYTSREIHFGSLTPLPISIPLRMKEGLATVDAELNHAPVHLLLDTGASSLIIFETRLPRSVSGLSISAVKRSTNLNGNFERKQVWLHSLKLGEAEFGQKPAFVVHDRSDAGRDFDGLMSPAALGITRIAVDLERGVLAFSSELNQ